MTKRQRLALIIAIGGAATVASARAIAGAPSGRFVVGGTSATPTVFDTQTKLTWEQSFGGPAAFPMLDPTARCAGLQRTTGDVGWRLPSLKELYTLVDFTGDPGPNAKIDLTAFPGTPATTFWTLTGNPNNGGLMLDFSDGYVVVNDVNATRCVR